ncbi:MAG: hypothetical protein WKG06_42620 [Segetibacter sp.]
MSSIYLLLLTLLLYIFFGTIVDTFIASNTSSRLLGIKTKIFFHTFIAPILFSLVLLLVTFTNNKTLNILFGCGLILASIIRIFSTSRMYLTEFRIDDKNLTVTYLTHFLKPYSRQFSLIDITNFEVTKAIWLSEYPASVNIRHKEEWITFEIIDKKLKAEVKSDIAEANIGIANSNARH